MVKFMLNEPDDMRKKHPAGKRIGARKRKPAGGFWEEHKRWTATKTPLIYNIYITYI